MILDKPWFILFFSPRCSHCIHFKPMFKEFHTMYHKELNMGSVDCTDSKSRSLCKLFKVGAYPTLLYYTNDQLEGPAKVYKFAETRSIDTLEKFAIKGGFKDSNWLLVPEDQDAKDKAPLIDFGGIQESIIEPLQEFGNAVIEPLVEVNKVIEEPFSGKKTFWEIVGTDVRRFILIGIVAVPLIVLIFCILGFNKKAKPLKRKTKPR